MFSEKSFEGIVPHKQKIKSGEAVLRFYSTFFSLTKKDSYRLIGHWKLTSLPKYGAVDGGFAFQAGPESPTGDKPVIYFFATRSGREIQALFDSVCRAGEAVLGQESHTGTYFNGNRPYACYVITSNSPSSPICMKFFANL